MKAKYLRELEKVIGNFLDSTCDEWLDDYYGYYHEELEEQMALAAAQVMDAAFMAQNYMREAEDNLYG